MARTSIGKYEPGAKGYLTYPIYEKEKKSPEEQDKINGLLNCLLSARTKYIYSVDMGDKLTLKETYISKTLADALKEMNIKTYVTKTKTYIPKKTLTVKINGPAQVIAVEIHKIAGHKEGIKEIRIRVAAPSDGEVRERLHAIQEYLSEWHVEPRECMWTQGGWEDQEEKKKKDKIVEKVQHTKYENRMKQILNKHEAIIEDLQDQVASLKNTPVKMAITDDRKVKEGVLR